MKARKLPSGKWNVQVLDYVDGNGKKHVRSFTASTKVQAEYMAARFKSERTEGGENGAVYDMVERSVRAKASVLSPSTLRGYNKVLNQYIKPSTFGKVRVNAVSSRNVQAWISWMVAKGLSPKSVKNAVGVFTSCYTFSGGEKRFNIRLPQATPKRKHVPSIADVKAVLDYFANDADMTAAIRLCAFASLRRGEVCVLDAHSIDRERQTITVSKAMVLTPEGDWITKAPKTASSHRVVPVSQFVLDALPKTGRCVNLNPNQVTNRFCRAIKELAVEPFSFHDLRHFYASLAHNRGVSDITIQTAAGWSSASTMKSIYWGEISEETREQTDKLNGYIDRQFRAEFRAE